MQYIKTARQILRQDGVTLTELIIVVSIIAIIVVALGFQFQGWIKKYKIESQVRQTSMDLMSARAAALQKNMMHFFALGSTSYQCYADTNGNMTFDSGDQALWSTSTKIMSYPVGWSSTFIITTRGLISPDATIRFDTGGTDCDYDCMAVTETRIGIGKYDGTSCNVK